MPRKDNRNIRRVTLRLDISDPEQAAIWQYYQSLKGDGSRWIRDALMLNIRAAIDAGAISPALLNGDATLPESPEYSQAKKRILRREGIDLKGDSTPPDTETSPAVAFDEQTKRAQERYKSDTGQDASLDKAKVTSPTPLPPGYGPRQHTSVFSAHVRPIPAFVGRKSE